MSKRRRGGSDFVDENERKEREEKERKEKKKKKKVCPRLYPQFVCPPYLIITETS